MSLKAVAGQRGFPTPSTIPDGTNCRQFLIPASGEYLELVMGCLDLFRYPWNWYHSDGGISVDDAVETMSAMLDATLESVEAGTNCVEGTSDVETPYWDDASDVETNEPVDTQTWYGTVSNPTAAPAELDFVENALVWGFTGLIALATPELGFAPAIAFNTIAPKFLIAQKAGDLGEVIRIIVDGQDAASVNTSGHAGEIINTPILADPTLSSHQIYIVGTPA